MTDEPPKTKRSLLVRAALRATRRARQTSNTSIQPVLEAETEAKPRHLLRRAAGRVRKLVSKIPIQASLERSLLLLSDPRLVRLLQASLTHAGNLGMEAAFTREPIAKRLFDYASWCDEEAGRGQIMGLLMQDAMSPQGGFFNIYRPLMELGAIKDPLAALASSMPGDRFTQTLQEAQLGALRTLCTMGAVATNTSPPDASTSLEELASFFQDLEIPEQFVCIADLATGKILSLQDEPEHKEEKGRAETEESPSSSTTTLEKARSWLPTRSLSPGLRFVIGPYLLFLQFYLTRNMVDALPNVMERVRDTLQEDDFTTKEEEEQEPLGAVLDMD